MTTGPPPTSTWGSSSLTPFDYGLVDPRVVLVPLEHGSAAGTTRAFRDFVIARVGWSAEQVDLLDEGMRRYWARARALAQRTPTWPMPRARHVAIVSESGTVRPYAQLLNTNAWTLEACDLDPATSDPEVVAYMFAAGDWMMATGEVTQVAVHAAPWWFDRTTSELAAFTRSVQRSVRSDAAVLRAVADALPWLRRLHHVHLRPPERGTACRPIPASGVLVPVPMAERPQHLVTEIERYAHHTLATYRARWRETDPAALTTLAAWLADTAPPLVVTGAGGAIVWAPDTASSVDGVRARLADADGVAVRAIHDDLRVVDRHTRTFLAAVVDPAALPAPSAQTFQSGYTYFHAERRLVAYNLDEPGMERLVGLPLPYARSMLGARTLHEWAHLVEHAGWVPRSVDQEEFEARQAAFATAMLDAIAAAPEPIRRRTEADLAVIAHEGNLARGLVRLLMTRMPDWKANLVVRAFASPDESETYVRQNVRPLRGEYRPEQVWRLVLRYVYEIQYAGPALGMTRVADPKEYFVACTGLADDLFTPGVLTPTRFDSIVGRVAAICDAYRVDETRLRLPATHVGPPAV